MTETLKIAIAQINTQVGAIDKTLAAIRAARAKAAALGADLVVTTLDDVARLSGIDSRRPVLGARLCGRRGIPCFVS